MKQKQPSCSLACSGANRYGLQREQLVNGIVCRLQCMRILSVYIVEYSPPSILQLQLHSLMITSPPLMRLVQEVKRDRENLYNLHRESNAEIVIFSLDLASFVS